jgi:hypothetical protein
MGWACKRFLYHDPTELVRTQSTRKRFLLIVHRESHMPMLIYFTSRNANLRRDARQFSIQAVGLKIQAGMVV